jgi:LPXTG-site transpeptidase (sortase) family protein
VAFYAGDSPKILNRGVWHRYPERGDPKKGGNFILSAHRFELGITPLHTKEKSPFYNVDKLAVGDEIKIYFDRHWYNYKIDKIYNVKPQQISIESPSDAARLTLYTCSKKGAADGRVVLEATQS